MNISIEEAINDLEQEKNELDERINTLKSLQTHLSNKIISENMWHELCETSLRSSDLLCDIVGMLFPEATNIELRPNYVTFDLFDFKCYLPTSRAFGIQIDMSWYHAIDLSKISNRQNVYTLVQYKQYIDAYTSNKNKCELIDILFPQYKHLSNFRKKLVYYKKCGKHHLYSIDNIKYKYNYYWKLIESDYDKKLKEKIEIRKKIESLNQNVIPILHRFTDSIYSAGFYNVKDMRSIIEFEGFIYNNSGSAI